MDNMGEALGIFYYTLWKELAFLYMKWKEYVKLFGTDPSHIELINKVASGFLDGGVFVLGKYCIAYYMFYR